MARSDQSKGLGGGIFLAIGPVLGALIGSFYGQSSAGLLIGLGIGVLLLLFFWWRAR